MPLIRNVAPGHAIIDDSRPILPQAIDAIANLDHSYLFMQGPPGRARRTRVARHRRAPAARLSRGCLFEQSQGDQQPAEGRRTCRPAKPAFRISRCKESRRSDNEGTLHGSPSIADVFDNESTALPADFQLVAGTAWLFARHPASIRRASIFCSSMKPARSPWRIWSRWAPARRNIVLLGDQMQLAQPIQGVHPGRSGESSLEYLLERQATIPPERGIFLKTTWRMHPDVCRFISDAVYDGRLEPRPENVGAVIAAGRGRASGHLLRPACAYVAVEHDGCSQSSEEEAALVLALFREPAAAALSGQGRQRHIALTPDNILVVAPYNMQVNLLEARSAEWRARRDRRQVPGAGGRGRHRLDGNLQRRLPAAIHRVPVQQEPG